MRICAGYLAHAVEGSRVQFAQAVDSWLKGLDSAEQRAILSSLFDKYVSAIMTHCSRNFKTVTPVIPINQAQTVCKILEGLLLQVPSGAQCLSCCCLTSDGP